MSVRACVLSPVRVRLAFGDIRPECALTIHLLLLQLEFPLNQALAFLVNFRLVVKGIEDVLVLVD